MGMRGITCVKKTPPCELPEKGRRGGRNDPKMMPRHKIPLPIGKRGSQRWKTVAMLVDSRARADSGGYGAPEDFLLKFRPPICPSQGSQDGGAGDGETFESAEWGRWKGAAGRRTASEVFVLFH